MTAPIGPRRGLRLFPFVVALLLGIALLAGCSSEPTEDTAAVASAAAEDDETAASDPAAGADADAAEEVASTPVEPPATTAQPPVAWYPADPNIEPVVDLGPAPAGYVAPRPECPPEAKACVDLTNNMTWVQIDGAVVFGPVQHIAGRPDYRTTPGMHEVFWKNIDHVSTIYHTPMPYAVFFTASGMAFHEGPLTQPSHGCIHLTHEAAVAYWDHLHNGDLVFVFGEAQY